MRWGDYYGDYFDNVFEKSEIDFGNNLIKLRTNDQRFVPLFQMIFVRLSNKHQHGNHKTSRGF